MKAKMTEALSKKSKPKDETVASTTPSKPEEAKQSVVKE